MTGTERLKPDVISFHLLSNKLPTFYFKDVEDHCTLVKPLCYCLCFKRKKTWIGRQFRKVSVDQGR